MQDAQKKGTQRRTHNFFEEERRRDFTSSIRGQKNLDLLTITNAPLVISRLMRLSRQRRRMYL